MTKSATRVAADKVTFTQAEVTSAVALKAPIAAPVFTGNVGVGVTPETSGSNYNVLQIGQGGSLMAPTATEDMYVGSNVYRNSSNTNSYIVTEKASIYEQYNGEHYFNVAPSGSADAAISFAQGMKSPCLISQLLVPIVMQVMLRLVCLFVMESILILEEITTLQMGGLQHP